MLGGHSPGLLPMFIGQEGFVASFAGKLQFFLEGFFSNHPYEPSAGIES